MAEPEAVIIEAEEIEQGQDGDAKRERSTIEFPYLDLDAAVEVAKGVYKVGGTSCGWDQLAAQLKQAAAGGGFRLRMMTAKTFGLLTYGQGTVTLTELGQRLNDPQQEKAAKADAFLKVPLYFKIYENYKNTTLPPTDALESEIVKMGVAPKQKGKARQAFQRSAQSADYFWSGSNRLVRPAIKGSAGAAASPVNPEEKEEPEDKGKKEKDKKRETRLHPLIEGLLEELPEPKTEWPIEERKNWLEMVSGIFNVIYKNSDDSRGSLKVVVDKNSSAK
ncbi:MAG TPA: hypothetical protein VK788_13525 [Terriglobales bacterium]|jgi:hypothetical protein|nr:hypothetical protein [Terriglobales bacterium]